MIRRAAAAWALAAVLPAGSAPAARLVEAGLVHDRLVVLRIADGRGIYSTLGNPVDEHVEEVPLDLAKAGDPAAWRVGGQRPLRVGRKTKGRDYAIGSRPWRIEFTREHWIYLELPKPIGPGEAVRVLAPGLLEGDPAIEVRYDPDATRSAAVHANQVGFRSDLPKYAYVAHWAGTLGPVDFGGAPRAFRVIDERTGRTAFSGRVALRQPADAGPEGGQPGEGNHWRTGVWECEFSALREPGRYRVCVDGVGCSFPFAVGPDVHREAFRTTMRGLYHQRCGTPLVEPWAAWTRSACHHPAIRPIRASTRRYLDGHCDACKDPAPTDEARAVWGGYHDAGDWDREGGHVEIPAVLSLAYLLAPANFRDGDLLIPESANGVPDLLDEARWALDYYRRLQRPDGGVSVGLFLDSFPDPGEAADTCTGGWFVYAEDPEVSFKYAASAGWFAAALRRAGRPDDAAGYVASARRAWDWAERNLRGGDAEKIRDVRLHAAACLFRETGDRRFHDAFRRDLKVTGPTAPLSLWNQYDQRWAVWAYALADRPGIDAALRAALREAAVNWARADVVETAARRAGRYGWHWWMPFFWGRATVPDPFPAAVAFAISGDRAFLEILSTTCDLMLGGNPLDLTWVTGLGSRWPEQVFQPDGWYHDPHGRPSPGLVPEGPFRYEGPPDPGSGPWDPKFVHASAHPDAKDWPPLELYFEARTCYPMNEFTVRQIAEAAAAYGLLCGIP